MMRFPILLLAAVAPALAAARTPPAQTPVERQRAEWNQPAQPFRLLGNVHYVGMAGVSAYLITSPDGHVLIDGGMEESAPRIAASIRALGFRVEDVRYILINHAHWDHAGGLAELKRLTGARLVASAADAPDLAAGRNPYRDDVGGFAPVAVDRIVGEGDTVALGGVTLTAHMTSGHAKGCTSWTLPVTQEGRTFSVLFACSLSVAGQRLVGDTRYPEAAADFRATFARLRALQADAFLGFHPSQFDLAEKRRRLEAGDPLAFVSAQEVETQIDRAEAAFETELAAQGRTASTGSGQ